MLVIRMIGTALAVGLATQVVDARAAEQVNLSIGASASASSAESGADASEAIDGRIADDSRWVSKVGEPPPAWLQVDLPTRARIGGVHIHSGWKTSDAIADFHVECRIENEWQTVPAAVVRGNRAQSVAIAFDDIDGIETDAIRLVVDHRAGDVARVRELQIWPYSADGIPRLPTTNATPDAVPRLYLNQSGFNRGKPKRFTAPLLADGTPFAVCRKGGHEALFEGRITDHIGDFTPFDPDAPEEYVVRAGKETSVPFRIGRFWLERVTYRGSIDFMADARHYVGTFTAPSRDSFSWRDDHQFSFELNGLVPQYLANPAAYDRMARSVPPVPPGDGTLWGALHPCDTDVPDIVRLIHWGADVIVTQRFDHMLFKEQLAFFLHGWPALARWLPQQNHDAVLAYVQETWTKPKTGRKYPHDTIRENHDLLQVKTQIGTTKGENPPGHSILPNLLMHEVAVRERLADADRYFRAAHDQATWVIEHVDWNDPLTTKGQRMSEHVVLAGLGMLLRHHGDRAPAGLREKLHQWAEVAVARSDNLWDFRTLSATQWVPTGPKPTQWNEPGNVMGFPACVLAVMPAVDDAGLRVRLEQLVWSHMDNCFGRNPCGRHFSHDAPREIEGVEFGWFSAHKGGVGQLQQARFVFDGSPKNGHYPYHPEVGDIGWTEGWVAFNSAWNASLAALALHETRLESTRDGNGLVVRLRAPLDFDERARETAVVTVVRHGNTEQLHVSEEGEDSEWLSATVADAEGISQVSYGYGLWRTAADLSVGR